MPYGSTQPENIEKLSIEMGTYSGQRGPLFLFYDQEPILGNFNYELLDHVQNNFMGGNKFILVTTERDSDAVDQIQQKYGCATVYYFHHVFASHDWFRGVKYDARLVAPSKRHILKKYISFNRLTSSKRVYRSLLISELYQRGLLDQGYVSYNDSCPDGGTYQQNLQQAVTDQLIDQGTAALAINNIGKINLPLRIDYQDQTFIPNHSFVLSAVEQSQHSFCYLVTETCYWDRKSHLTEKTFKAIVSQMPFVIAGPAHSLKYLRSYGFQTFGQWIDESYDDVEDPVLRMQAIGDTMTKICNYSLHELERMLSDMQAVLEHNYNLFYSQQFVDHCWQELTNNLSQTVAQINSLIYCPLTTSRHLWANQDIERIREFRRIAYLPDHAKPTHEILRRLDIDIDANIQAKIKESV